MIMVPTSVLPKVTRSYVIKHGRRIPEKNEGLYKVHAWENQLLSIPKMFHCHLLLVC